MDPRRYMLQQGWDNNSALKGYGAVHEPEFRGGGSYSSRRFHDEPYSRDPIYARGVFHREVLERNSCPPAPSVGTWHQRGRKFFDEGYAIARESRHHEKSYLESYHDIDGFHGDDKYREMDTFHAFDRFRDSYRPIENYRDVNDYRGHDKHARFKGRDRDGISVDDYEYRHHGSRHQWAVNSPNNQFERAKIVLNSSSEPRTLNMQSAYKNSPARVNIHHQERRSTMSSKRARFSLRPCTSQSTVVGGMNLNIDKLRDPEEYFLAFEKHERVEKESRKQRRDVPTDLTKHIPTTAPQSRRRGISGRKASRGRLFSSLVANLDKTIGSSGKVPEMDPTSQSNKTPNLAITDEHGASKEKKLARNGFMGATQDSVAKEMNKGGLSDELILQGGTNLDGDEAVKYFQERLQIKPVNLEKLFLSEVDDGHRNDGEVSLKQLPRQKKALSEVDDAVERAKGKENVETQQIAESSNISPDSPTPLRSPFSSRHLSDGARLGKPFLPPGIEDDSPVRGSTHDEGIGKGALLLHFDSNYEPVEVEVNRNGPSFTFVSMTTEKPPADTAESAHSIDLKDGKVGGTQPEALVEGRDDPVETYMDVDKLVTDDSAHFLNPVLDNLHKSSKVMDLSSNGLQDGFEDTQHMDTVGSNLAEPSCEGLSIENLHCSGSSQAGTLGPTVNEDHAKGDHANGQSQITDTLPGENNQESPRESPNVLNKQKGSRRSGRKGPLVHRKSLAGVNVGNKEKSRATRRSSCPGSLEGAGTQWQGGQRKSTRIRVRPLEFWRGERFLYGRVEESLPTVIACKYASPGKGDPKHIN